MDINDMRRILIIAPHPDDETLGCGGMLLRLKQQGANIAWLIMTDMSTDYGYPIQQVTVRQSEIVQVSSYYHFDKTYNLKLPPTKLDIFPRGEIIQKIGAIISEYQPDTLLIPHYGDIHSDHRIVFEATISCSKCFRYPYIRKIITYETLSETDFSLVDAFKPNLFINIDDFLEKKLIAMRFYQSELGIFPFPRSEKSICSLAAVRGSQAGCDAAEAFTILKEIW